MNYCPATLTLLEPITTGEKLKFKSNKTGTIYEAKPEDTFLAGGDANDELQSVSKYRITLSTTAFNPLNPRVRIPDGCSQCGRKIISFQRVGDNKSVTYACVCGNSWTY